MNSPSKLPFSISKKEFTAMLYPVPENTILNRINTIIYDRRKSFKANEKKTITAIKKVHYIERPEYIEYFEIYGLPDGITF